MKDFLIQLISQEALAQKAIADTYSRSESTDQVAQMHNFTLIRLITMLNKVLKSLKGRQMVIMSLVKDNPGITNKEISAKTGLGESHTANVTKHLRFIGLLVPLDKEKNDSDIIRWQTIVYYLGGTHEEERPN